MDKAEIRTEIKDLSYRMEFHAEQADFHREVAEKTLKTLKTYQGQLVDMQVAEEPKVVHGNIRAWDCCDTCISITDLSGPKPCMLWPEDMTKTVIDPDRLLAHSMHIGHIKEVFTDLKAQAEDLTEFKVEDELYSPTIDFSIGPDGQLKMVTNDSERSYRIKDLPAFIQKLQRLHATYLRKVKGNG